MINYKKITKNWLEQSGQDLKQAKKFLDNGDFSYACFFAEQSAQKSVKGYLIFNKQMDIFIHAISELMERASKFDSRFKGFTDEAKGLDKYYLTTRYPDALPDHMAPYKAHTKGEAQRAVKIAQKIFDLCQKLTSNA